MSATLSTLSCSLHFPQILILYKFQVKCKIIQSNKTKWDLHQPPNPQWKRDLIIDLCRACDEMKIKSRYSFCVCYFHFLRRGPIGHEQWIMNDTTMCHHKLANIEDTVMGGGMFQNFNTNLGVSFPNLWPSRQVGHGQNIQHHTTAGFNLNPSSYIKQWEQRFFCSGISRHYTMPTPLWHWLGLPSPSTPTQCPSINASLILCESWSCGFLAS